LEKSIRNVFFFEDTGFVVPYLPPVASREIETTGFDPASQFLSNISRRA
jgi:hypothetical protein